AGHAADSGAHSGAATAQGDAYQRARAQARAAVSDGLLDLADARLAEEGPAALSMRRLANAAGCSTMVFYSAFGTKNGLLTALARREADRWIDAATTLADPDPVAWLDAVAAALLGAAGAHPHHRALLFDPEVGGDAVARLRSAVLEAIDRAVPGAVADGVAEAVWAGWVGALADDDAERFAQVQRGLGRLWAGYVASRASPS
ncbi:MAG: TetR/AcrR family transcriptional regulator, partial [Trueperaceae bacterium]|nr:TetR/AcrR family transcriptional regulator [Trueperaceae bacterium]